MRINRWAGLITAVLLLLTTTFITIQAHGGGRLVAINDPVGSMTASVWFNPPVPQANETLHVTVSLGSAVDGAPIIDETIEVAIQDGGEIIWRGFATNAASTNRLFYEADITAVSRGNYDVIVTIVGQGQLAIPLEVVPTSLNYPLFGLVALLAIGVNLLFFYRWRRGPNQAAALPKKQKARSASPFETR